MHYTLGQEYRFTGHEHDTETNNDYFGARYYSSTFGRFLTPDWAATPVPVPYAVMGNPQTLNLYAYVENNPITGTDPDGHFDASGASAQGDPTTCQAISCTDPEELKKKQERDRKLREWIERTIAELAAMGHFVGGFGKGVGASLSWGTVEAWNPQPTDTPEERLGEIAGTSVVGGVGTNMAVGGGGTAAATLPACASGAGCLVPLTAAGVSAAGSAMAGGAARSAAALVSTPMQMTAEHTSKASPSTEEKHQEGRARAARDYGGEKGQRPGTYPRRPPKDWKTGAYGNKSGKWPPTNPRDQAIADRLLGR